MCPTNPLGAMSILGAGDFLAQVKAGVDAADYFMRKMDAYERDQRYDDNQKHMVVQAMRMYEQGQLSKEQLKAIIDLLPSNGHTQTVEVKTQRPELVPQQRRSEFDLGAMLQQLTYN